MFGREGRRRSGHKTKPASRPWEGFKEGENLLRPRAANELPARSLSEEVGKQANEWGSGKKEEKKPSRRARSFEHAIHPARMGISIRLEKLAVQSSDETAPNASEMPVLKGELKDEREQNRGPILLACVVEVGMAG